MYLLDTNVISEAAFPKSPARPIPELFAGRKAFHRTFFICLTMTILELQLGLLRLERHDLAQCSIPRTWIEDLVLPGFYGRILPFDVEVAQRCAALHVPNPKPERDAIIAATALVHRMTVVTRNVADFAPTGVPVLNPWTS